MIIHYIYRWLLNEFSFKNAIWWRHTDRVFNECKSCLVWRWVMQLKIRKQIRYYVYFVSRYPLCTVASLRDIYKYLNISMMYIKIFPPRFVRWSDPYSCQIDSQISIHGKKCDFYWNFVMQLTRIITLKYYAGYSEWLLNGEKMWIFPIVNLHKEFVDNVSINISFKIFISSISIALLSQICVFL